MKKWLVAGAIAIIFLFPNTVEASELIKGHATAYCLNGVTASGEKTREGICASSSNRLGKTIILYQRLPDDSMGKMIGKYESKDTGATKGLKSGYVVDVWKPSLDDCQDFMDTVYEDGCKGRVYIQVLD